MREAWNRVTIYDSMGRPGVLDGLPDSSEVALDMEAGGWWVRDRVRYGFLLLFSGWGEPYLITPGSARDPHKDSFLSMLKATRS